MAAKNFRLEYSSTLVHYVSSSNRAAFHIHWIGVPKSNETVYQKIRNVLNLSFDLAVCVSIIYFDIMSPFD